MVIINVVCNDSAESLDQVVMVNQSQLNHSHRELGSLGEYIAAKVLLPSALFLVQEVRRPAPTSTAVGDIGQLECGTLAQLLGKKAIFTSPSHVDT